jgi:predicted lipoprotein with Yx(FWY)xxD motif
MSMVTKYGGKRVPVLAFAALSLVMSACASKSSSGTGSGSGSGSGGGSGSNSGTSSSGAIATASEGGVGKVLVNGQGFTLYYRTTDNHSTPTCTGSCLSLWPPQMVSGAVPAAASGMKGTFATVASPAGGKQLTYMGWPLYTYSGDSGPKQDNGQGIDGVWFAMSTSGPTSTGGSPSSGSSGSGGSGGGGYGGY